MKELDFVAAMSVGLPALPSPVGLDAVDSTGILKGNADLELPDAERAAKEAA